MDEIVSILQNPEKIEQLISKLKTIGKDFPKFQKFKRSIDSFHLNKPPRGVHQTNILQHVFKYSDSRECFDSFRLVCKTWQNAVETIRLDISPPFKIFQELCLHEINGQFPPFYSKYLQRFRKLKLDLLFGHFDMTKWNSISNLLLKNMQNLSEFSIRIEQIPPKFVIFLFHLFQNSKSTLTNLLVYQYLDIVTLPTTITLPNLTLFSFTYPENDENQISAFDSLIKTVVDIMCPNLKIFRIKMAPQILKYITKNYANHFVCAPEISMLDHIPLKISYLKLENVSAYRYASHIEYLSLDVKHVHAPSRGDWDDKEMLSFFPNLKGVTFCRNGIPRSIYSTFYAKTFWLERIDYFRSQNIKILSEHEYSEIISESRQSLSPSWSFQFRF